jgi:excisionase family DNA binding protein
MKKTPKTLIANKPPPYSAGQIHRPLTKEELMDYAQKSQKAIERAIDSGELTAVRIGQRSFRFRPADINRWLDKEVDPDRAGYFHGTRPQDIKKRKEGAAK